MILAITIAAILIAAGIALAVHSIIEQRRMRVDREINAFERNWDIARQGGRQ